MPHAVVDSAEIIQVKTAYSHILRRRFRIIQQFFAFILIGKSGRLVQINLFLQNAVLGRIAQCLKYFHGNQDQKSCDIREDHLLKLIQCRCLSLGIGLRKSGSLITDPEELLTLFNDLRVFIAIFPNKLYFHFQGFKIILQLLHLILECGIIQTDQV